MEAQHQLRPSEGAKRPQGAASAMFPFSKRPSRQPGVPVRRHPPEPRTAAGDPFRWIREPPSDRLVNHTFALAL